MATKKKDDGNVKEPDQVEVAATEIPEAAEPEQDKEISAAPAEESIPEAVAEQDQPVEDEEDEEPAEAELEEEPKELASLDPEQSGVQKGKPTRNRRDVLNDARRREQVRNARRDFRERWLGGWAELQSAMRGAMIREGEVSSVEMRSYVDQELGREIEHATLAVMYNKMFKVIIPFDEIFRESPLDMSSVDLTTRAGVEEFSRRQNSLASQLLGVTIPFIIMQMEGGNPEDHAILGSRQMALRIREHQNYDSIRRAKPIVQIGDTVDAQVIGVGPHALSLNVAGIDVRIRVADMTFRPCPNARNVYRCGDTVQVQITNIITNENGSHDIEVNGRLVELDDAKMKQHYIKLGSDVHGVITNVYRAQPRDAEGNAIEVRDGGMIRMLAYLPAYDMPALVAYVDPRLFGTTPTSGDEVLLRVNGFADNGFALTSLRRVLQTSNYNLSRL